MENYKTISRLGQGATSEVYLVEDAEKRRFALKKVRLHSVKKEKTKRTLLQEAELLRSLRHAHIVTFYESFLVSYGDFLVIVQEYCEGGTLDDKIEEAKKLKLSDANSMSEQQIMIWFVQILMALQYLHSNKILHRDIKAENVFLSKKQFIKLGDFGIARRVTDSDLVASTNVGTALYLSPERCKAEPYNNKSDIWALGCLLYELCALNPPFDGESLLNLVWRISMESFKPLSTKYSRELRHLVEEMLTKLPDDRPSACQLLESAFVKNHLNLFKKEVEASVKPAHQSEDVRDVTGRSIDSPCIRRIPNTAEVMQQLTLRCKSPEKTKKSPVINGKNFDQGASGINAEIYLDDFESDSEEEGTCIPEVDYIYEDDFEPDDEEKEIIEAVNAAEDIRYTLAEDVEDAEVPQEFFTVRDTIKREAMEKLGPTRLRELYEMRSTAVAEQLSKDTFRSEIRLKVGDDLCEVAYVLSDLLDADQ